MDEDDSIAIVGVGCMFPGARNLQEFWRVLINGEDHVQEIPMHRFSVDAFYDADPTTPGKSYVRNAGLMKGHDEWDNHFFGISDNEALHMDPQQRYVLECVHMAFEDGGITRKELNGSNTGVYIGAMNHDFQSYTDGDTSMVTNYTVTGANPSIIPARVSYFYNLLGPSIVLDTACSSSLVAIHTAVNAMRIGDIEMAVCGGVNSILNPEMFVSLSKARMASPTGHCHAFSKFADGYIRGEGCGIVVLKRLKEAMQDGNKIWATILTGCNQDGRTNTPITAPSQIQQEKLLEAVYLKNGIDPDLVQYIEAHGTGTPVGDPIEANALGNFFSRNMEDSDRVIKIGSVKASIGHLESAAGVAGLIKVLLMMENDTIVKSLHSECLNPDIPFEKYKLEVVQSPCDWSSKQPRLACVNCFGFGGTNSHAVVQHMPKQANQKLSRNVGIQRNNNSLLPTLVAFSAETPESLIEYINCFQEFLESKHHLISMANLSYTTCVRRDHLRFRKMVLSNTVEELQLELQKVVSEQTLIDQIPISSPNVIFVFGGVGTTWRGMCKEFLETSEIFKDTIKEFDKYLKPLAGLSVMDDKYLKPLAGLSVMDSFEQEEDIVDDPFVNHIAICACQIALTNTWFSLGVTPSSVVGQSVGEVAAAYASGSLTLEQAVQVIYHRSFVLKQSTGGRMTVVKNCKTSHVDKICRKVHNGKVCVAVYLSDSACTISGDHSAVEEVKNELEQVNVEPVNIIDLNVKCAYHSHFTAAAGDRLQSLLSNMSAEQPKVPVFSSVTGSRVERPYYASAEYWMDNVKHPVHFYKAVVNAASEKHDCIFLEISPRPVLNAHMPSIFPQSNELSLPSLQSKKEKQTFLQTLSRLYEVGVNFDWKCIVQPGAEFIDIPSYAYSKKYLFLESEQRIQIKTEGEMSSNSARLINRKPGMLTEFTLSLDSSNTKFIFEHIVEGLAIVPGAMYGEVGLEVGHSLLEAGTTEMEVSWQIENPCIVHEDEKQVMSIICRQQSDKRVQYKVVSKTNGTTFAEGSIAICTSRKPSMVDIQELKHTISKHRYVDLYQLLRSQGFAHGEIFQIVKKFISNNKEGFAEIELSPLLSRESDKTFFHPVIIDGMLQCCFPAFLVSPEYKNSRCFPTKIGSLVLYHQPVRKMFCYAKFHGLHDNTLVINLLLLRPDGIVIAEIQDYELTILRGPQDLTSITYAMTWEPFCIEQLQGLESNIMLITFDEEVVPLIKAALRKENIELEAIHLEDMTEVPEVIENMKSKLSRRKSSSLPTVVFLPGITTEKHISASRDDVYGCVRKTCHFFMRFVQAIAYTSINVVCITERTQSIDDSQSEKVNILGSELWGMARSIAQEVKLLKLTMVDVSPSVKDTLDGILTILIKISSGDETVPPEIKLSGSNLYESKLKHLQSVGERNQLRTRRINPSDTVIIRSDEKGVLKSIFGVLKECDYKTHNCVNVRFESAFIGTESTFLSNEKNCTFRDYWPEQKDLGYPVIACEIEGYICNSLAQDDGYKREVISCYPTELATEVQIPKDCVVPKSDIPHYTPGLLHKAILALNIADNVSPRSEVCIFHDHSFPGILQLLEIFLVEKRCVIRAILTETDFGEKLSLNATHIIVAARQTTKQFVEYHRMVPNATHLISFRGCFPSLSFFDTSKNSCVSRTLLDETALFCTSQLFTSFARVKPWLIKLSKKQRLPKSKYADNTEIICSSQLRNLEVKMPKELFLRRDAAYIVVGGLTGLGWLIVKFLSSCGAKMIISLSRKDTTEEILKRVANTQCLYGVRIFHFSVDICNLQSLMSTFRQIEKTFPNIDIKGIFQGAGVTDDVRVLNMTEEKLLAPLKPKVLGTWNLHIASLGMNLDYFIMHSSIVSILGHEGQSNYGAANAFMDSLASFRRKQGYPAQSINWGALEVGMTNDHLVRERLKMEGISNLTKQQIRSGLLKSALSTLTSVCFAGIKWDLFAPFANNRIMAKLSEVVSSTSKAISTKKGKAEIELDGFNELTETEQLRKMIDILHSTSADVLAIHKSEITPQSMLVDLGLDSQRATELISSLYRATRVRIPYAYVMSGGYSIKDIAKFIVEQFQKVSGDVDESLLIQDADFIEGSPTYMEKLYLGMLESDSYNPHLTITADYRISSRYSSSKIWVTALQGLLLFNPELRTVYRQTEGEKRWGFIKEVIDPEDSIVDFRVFKDEELFKQAMDSQERHDPTRSFPLRVLFYEGKKEAILRMIISHCSIDLGSSLTIANDFRSIALSLCHTNHLPLNHRRIPIDIALIMEERLQPRLKSLESFWTSQLQMVSDIPTVKTGNEVSIKLSEDNVSRKIFDKELVKEVQQYLYKMRQSIFGLICTIYQIVLHKYSKSSTVSVVSAVDLRHHGITELRNRVGLGVNFVPLIADLRDANMPLEDIFQSNCMAIHKNISNCLYPYEMLKALDVYDREKHSKHTIIIDDMTGFDGIQHEIVQLTRIGVYHDRTYETALSIFYNRNTSFLELRLGYQSHIVQEYIADTLLEHMEELLHVYLSNPNLELAQWIPRYDVMRHIPSEPEVSAPFFKCKKEGGGHNVKLSLKSSNYQTPLGICLEWGKTNGRRISLADINILKGRYYRGLPSIVLETNGKEHIFSSEDKWLVQTWVLMIWKKKEERR